MTYKIPDRPVEEYLYHSISNDLSPREIAGFIGKIQESSVYDLGECGHIYVTDTNIAVGFISDDRIDLINRHDSSLHAHHNSLIDFLSKSLE